jgi:hypothetical protein
MAFDDNINALASEIPSTVTTYEATAKAQLAVLQGDLAALTALQATIATAIVAINAQIAAYESIVPAPVAPTA